LEEICIETGSEEEPIDLQEVGQAERMADKAGKRAKRLLLGLLMAIQLAGGIQGSERLAAGADHRPTATWAPQQASQPAPQSAATTTQAPRRQGPADDEYLIGVGIADITGPAADINLVSLIQQLAATAGNSPVSNSGLNFRELIRIQHPSWRDLSDVKLQFKINFNPLLLRTPSMNALLRWAMPNQLKMQAEYTYANLVVQL